MLILKRIPNVVLTCFSALALCSWTSPTTISDVGSSDPFVSVNSSGEAFVAWTSTVGSDLVTQAAFYDGTSWNTAETISDTGFNVNPSIIINDNGDAVAVWELIDNGTYTVYASTRPTAGSWSTPVAISTADVSSFTSLAFNSDGQAIVGWINFDDDTIEVATLSFGNNWASPVAITSAGGNKGSLQVGIAPSGNCFAAWEESATGTIFAEQSDGFEGTWSEPSDLSGSSMNTLPSLSVGSDGSAIVSWVDNNTFNVFASLFLSGEWDSSPTMLSSDFTYYAFSSALDGDFFVSFQNLSTGQNQVLRYVSGTWDTAADISVDMPNGIPATSSANTESFTCWTDYSTGHIKVAEYGLTGSPTTPVEISGSDYDFSQVIASSTASSVAAWVAYTGSDTTTVVSSQSN